jgi:anti-sigma regulatory factor (Ser/Thr protein kinase)
MLTGRFTFESDPARYEVLAQLLRSVINPGATWVDEPLFRRLHLAVHELLVNITRHAYGRRNGVVEMHVSMRENSVLVSIFDRGREYCGGLDFDLPEEPTTGGYGLVLIDALANNLRYRHIGGENHWQLEFVRTAEALP